MRVTPLLLWPGSAVLRGQLPLATRIGTYLLQSGSNHRDSAFDKEPWGSC